MRAAARGGAIILACTRVLSLASVHRQNPHSYFASEEGCKVLWWLFQYVCLSASITRKPHDRTSSYFCACRLWSLLYLRRMASRLADYVLPVLWMASCVHTMGAIVPESSMTLCLVRQVAVLTKITKLKYSKKPEPWEFSGKKHFRCSKCIGPPTEGTKCTLAA